MRRSDLLPTGPTPPSDTVEARRRRRLRRYVYVKLPVFIVVSVALGYLIGGLGAAVVCAVMGLTILGVIGRALLGAGSNPDGP